MPALVLIDTLRFQLSMIFFHRKEACNHIACNRPRSRFVRGMSSAAFPLSIYCSAAVSANRTHRLPSPAAILIKSLSIVSPVDRTDQHDQGP